MASGHHQVTLHNTSAHPANMVPDRILSPSFAQREIPDMGVYPVNFPTPPHPPRVAVGSGRGHSAQDWGGVELMQELEPFASWPRDLKTNLSVGTIPPSPNGG